MEQLKQELTGVQEEFETQKVQSKQELQNFESQAKKRQDEMDSEKQRLIDEKL